MAVPSDPVLHGETVKICLASDRLAFAQCVRTDNTDITNN